METLQNHRHFYTNAHISQFNSSKNKNSRYLEFYIGKKNNSLEHKTCYSLSENPLLAFKCPLSHDWQIGNKKCSY